MNLPALSVRYPSIVTAVLFTAVAWGTVAFITMPRQEDPVIGWRLANVVTRWSGASPSRVETLITDVLEQKVKEVDEVAHVFSVSRSGVSLLQIQLGDEISNVAPVWQKVRHKLLEAAAELPEGTIGPDLNDEVMGTFAVIVALSGEGFTYRQLKDHAKELEDKLRYLPRTASTELFGTQQEVIQVELDQSKLAAYDLSFDQVAAAVSNRNARRPSGRLEVDADELLIEASGEFENETDLARMVLLVAPGPSPSRSPSWAGEREGVLRLGDVADIRRTTASPADPMARVNGRPAVMVGSRARSGVRIDDYGDEVMQAIDRFRATLPDGMQLNVLHDMAKYTRERSAELGWTLAQSIVLVFVATALFLGWRASAIVTVAIPITGVIVLALFLAVGVPLNQMSAMAMIMAIGMIVDCAIVVTEQIHRRWREGASVEEATSSETGQLFLPLSVAILTTLAAFLPIYLLPGGTGEFLRAIPVGVSICLLTSLAVAMTVVPWLCRIAMPRRIQSHSSSVGARVRWRSPFALEQHAWFRRLITGCVRRPIVVLLVVAVGLGALGSVGLRLRRDFFSPVQRDQFIIDVYAPQGSALAHTVELVEPIEKMLQETPEVTSVGAFVGRNAPLVFYNLWVQESYANHFAQLVVNVNDWHASAPTARRVQEQLKSQVPGAHCVVHILEHGAPFVAPFEVRISGPSVETLHELGRRASAALAGAPGVRNVRDNYGNEALQLVAQVNEPVARTIGIDQGTVADELRYRLDGLVASHLQEGDERIDIRIRLAGAQRANITDLNAVYFKPTADAPLIPFSSVATLEPSWETASIYRRDGQRTLSILAYPEFGLTAAQASQQFIPQLEQLAASLPPGYHLELGGENEQRQGAERNLLRKSIYAFCLIILLLVAEFHSFRLAGLILTVIPFSLAGTMLALWLTGWPLNFMAIMGMLMLVGVMVNDAVILVDGYERRRNRGEPLERLVVDGTLERTPHVVVTSVTTIAGFLPLALSQSPLWPPLALAIIGGLATSTILCLAAVPAAYSLLRRTPAAVA